MKYKVIFSENGKKKQATLGLASWEIREGESKEDAFKRILSNGAAGEILVLKVGRHSTEGREGFGNPRTYKN